MSERTRSASPDGATGEPRLSKSERRAAAKEAKARAAAAKRRRDALLGALAGLAVVVLLVGSYLIFSNSGDDDAGTGSAAPSATAAEAPGAAPAPPATQPANPGFPPLPQGADPALGSKPDAGRGEGELTALKATPLIEGTGPAAAAGQTITVNYVGVLYRTGEEFDASWNRSEPFSFQLGAGNVIPGWDQGLVGAKVGSRIQLDIPADLAYGDNPGGGRPAGPLRFIVDVLGVQ